MSSSPEFDIEIAIHEIEKMAEIACCLIEAADGSDDGQRVVIPVHEFDRIVWTILEIERRAHLMKEGYQLSVEAGRSDA